MTLEELRARALAEPTEANLRALADAITLAMRAIDTEAGDGALTADQETRWGALETEHAATLEKIEEQARSARVRDSRAKWRSTQFGSKTDPFDGRDVRSLNIGEVRSRALALTGDRSSVEHLDSMTDLGADATRAQEHVSKMIRTRTRNFDGDRFARYLLASESEAYRSAFMKIVGRGASGAFLTPEEARAVEAVNETRAAMSLSDANGGYGVPVFIDPTIILTAQGHPNDFFTIARVENITNDEWKGVSSAGATSYWTTEGTQITGGDPTLAQPNVVTKRLSTYVTYSFEIGGDYPGFATEVGRVMAESQSEALVSAFTNGLGTTAQPVGITTAILAGGTSYQLAVTTDGSFGATDVYKLWDALPIKYRGNASWMASTSVANAVRQFAAGSSNSDANFTINITQMELERLFGRPFYYNDYMSDAVGTGGATSASDLNLLIVGDFRNFLIANRVGATVETVQHVIDTTTGTPTGQRGVLMWRRLGSDSINDNGFRMLTQD